MFRVRQNREEPETQEQTIHGRIASKIVYDTIYLKTVTKVADAQSRFDCIYFLEEDRRQRALKQILRIKKREEKIE